jgi:hypothetical protein
MQGLTHGGSPSQKGLVDMMHLRIKLTLQREKIELNRVFIKAFSVFSNSARGQFIKEVLGVNSRQRNGGASAIFAPTAYRR